MTSWYTTWKCCGNGSGRCSNYIRKAIGYDDYLREYANERRLKPEDLFEVLDALQESAVPFKTYEAWFNHMDEYKEQLKEQSALREAEKKVSV